jgi:hypothetical protein
VGNEHISGDELVALRAALLRYHEEFVGYVLSRSSARLQSRLERFHLSWLGLPWMVIDMAAMFTRRPPSQVDDAERQINELYRQVSGRDPEAARAEVDKIHRQLWSLDERIRGPDDSRGGGARGADSAELAAAADALIGYYLKGRQTHDDLLSEIVAIEAERQELMQRTREGFESRGMLAGRRYARVLARQAELVGDRHLESWRRWLDQRKANGPPVKD